MRIGIVCAVNSTKPSLVFPAEGLPNYSDPDHAKIQSHEDFVAMKNWVDDREGSWFSLLPVCESSGAETVPALWVVALELSCCLDGESFDGQKP